jgi:hypothetical protein
MPYDASVATRLRAALERFPGLEEKRMFGGIAYLFGGNMACGVVNDELMVRVGPDGYEEALALPHTREMDFTGKPLRGFVYVEPAGFASDEGLAEWAERGASFARSLPPK